MSEIRGLILLVLVTCSAFMYVGFSVPQIESEPVEIQTEIGESPEALVAAGRRIVASDRAQCLTCHSLGEDPKARCPNLEILTEVSGSRRPGMDAAEYLIESLYDPNAFIVSGYPKNQMNPVNKPPIALSHDEVLAVTCYLYGGTTVEQSFIDRAREAQRPWRSGERTPNEGGDEEEGGLPVLEGDPRRGRQVFFNRGCGACHQLEGIGAETAPDLSAIGGSQTGEYILESIIDPRAVIVKGYEEANPPMPLNFGELLTPREIYDLLAYLLEQKGEP